MRILPLAAAVVVLLPLTQVAAHAEEVTPPPAVASAEEPQDATPPASAAAVTLGSTSYSGFLDTTVPVTGTVAGSETATVRLARLVDAAWQPLDVPVTSTGSAFSADLPVTAASTQVRAELVDDGAVVATSAPATVAGKVAATALTLSMPTSVVDYQSVQVTAALSTEDGRAPSGSVDLVFRKTGEKTWSVYRSIDVVDGAGTTSVTPRHDGRFELRFAGTTSLGASTSAFVTFDNRPPGKAVKLPKGASRPSIKLPAQKRADRVNADAQVSKISDAVWKSMKGRSWRSGCPVGRSDLRILRVSYWAFDGYVRRGEIVVHRKHAAATEKVFEQLFAAKAPIRSMYRVDRFGYNKTLKGADDYKSMRADNTSGFNCRRVVGNPSRRSPHAYGKAIDINPWENPYASPRGRYPNKTWHKRSSPANVTYRGKNDPVVKIFRTNGFRWLGSFDLQHFER